MKTNDGGPAFPVQNIGACSNPYGMSLRDYFAAAALQGLIAGHLRTVTDDVKLAWEYADTMIAYREKESK